MDCNATNYDDDSAVYDGYDEYNASYDYAYGNPFNMNDLCVQLLFTKCLQFGQCEGAMKKQTQVSPQHDDVE